MEEFDFEDSKCNLLLAKYTDSDEKAVCEKKDYEIRRPDESCSYFTIDVELGTGYKYQFIAHIIKDDEKREFFSDQFEYSGIYRNVKTETLKSREVLNSVMFFNLTV